MSVNHASIMLRFLRQSKLDNREGVDLVKFMTNRLPTVDNKTRSLLFNALNNHLLDFIECHEEHFPELDPPLSVIDLAAHSIRQHKSEEALELLIGLI